nr:MAG TPA: hypothetical protein [Caudoviricetes sp.]
MNHCDVFICSCHKCGLLSKSLYHFVYKLLLTCNHTLSSFC